MEQPQMPSLIEESLAIEIFGEGYEPQSNFVTLVFDIMTMPDFNSRQGKFSIGSHELNDPSFFSHQWLLAEDTQTALGKIPSLQHDWFTNLAFYINEDQAYKKIVGMPGLASTF